MPDRCKFGWMPIRFRIKPTKRDNPVIKISKIVKISGKSVIQNENSMGKTTRLNQWIYLSPEPRSVSGDGSFVNPYDASSISSFDTIMSGLKENSFIKLMKGHYYTRGRQINGTERVGDWSIKSGWKIQGEGIGETVIHLNLQMLQTTSNLLYAIFGNRLSERIGDVEISDITFALDMHTTVPLVKNIGSSAIYLQGSRCKIKNCEVLDYGTTSTSQEGFSLYIGGGYTNSINIAENNSIENCYVNRPTYWMEGSNTCIYIGGGWYDSKFSQQINPVIKNNFIYGYTGASGHHDSFSKKITGIVIESTNFATIESNKINGVRTAGPACSNHHNTNTVIRYNDFHNIRSGIVFYLGGAIGDEAGAKSNLGYAHIISNHFGLKLPDSTDQVCAIAIRDSSNSKRLAKGITVSRNEIGWTGYWDYAATPNNDFLALDFDSTSGLYCTFNYIDLPCTSATNQAPFYLRANCEDWYIHSNTCVVYSVTAGAKIPHMTGNLIPYQNQN